MHQAENKIIENGMSLLETAATSKFMDDLANFNGSTFEKRKEFLNSGLIDKCKRGVKPAQSAAVLYYPNPTLKKVAEDITDFGVETQNLIDLLIMSLYAHKGIGLAAPQIGWNSRVFVIDLNASDDKAKSDLMVFVNPQITVMSNEKELCKEGCLSFPGVLEPINRAKSVVGKAWDRNGVMFNFSYINELKAVAVQHEFDHLNGVLLIDHVGRLAKRIVTRKMTRTNRVMDNGGQKRRRGGRR